MYMEINTGFVMSRKELIDIWENEYDGNDYTNAMTFEEFLQGQYYVKDCNGKYIACYFEKI